MQYSSFLYFLWQRFHLDQDLAGWRTEMPNLLLILRVQGLG